LFLRWAFVPETVRLQVQNSDDRALLNGLGISTPEQTDLVPGSGLNLENFPETPEPEGVTPKAVLVSRMLYDKGVSELIEAARILKSRDIKLDIILVGAPDPANPASIPESVLKAWVNEGLAQWQGQRSDVADIIKDSHIAVLPSYREGMPKSLLEAAAIGRPLVAFDAPGCRDLVRDGKNGLLVAFKDVHGLADALEKLAKDEDLRRRLGHQARLDVESTYSSAAIEAQLKSIFRRFI
jgi:glycosyltransferase involved in cell wall biosynthesis